MRLGRTTRFGLRDKSVLTLLGETGPRLDITRSLCRMLLYSFRQRYLRKVFLGGAKILESILSELRLPLQLSTARQITGRCSERNNHDNPADKTCIRF